MAADPTHLPGNSLSVRLIGTKAWVVVKGDLDLPVLRALVARLAELPEGAIQEMEVDLSDCDADGAMPLLEAINLVRGWLRQGVAVTLHGAPQLLAHDLYRVGLLLPGSRLHLDEPRNEIGYS